MDVKKVFGTRLREARIGAGLTQKRLGDAIGVNHAAIAQYEAGSNTTPLERAIHLAFVLNISLDYLCGLSDDPTIRWPEPSTPDAHISPPSEGGES